MFSGVKVQGPPAPTAAAPHAGPCTQVMFSKPLPDFSCRLNALATALTCQWLMGPCKVNDVEVGGCTASPPDLFRGVPPWTNCMVYM